MNAKRIILSGVILWIIGTIFMMLTCGWLFSWVYKLPPNIWLEPEQIMSTNNFIGSNIAGIGRSLILALVFAILYKGLPFEGIKKGVFYGVLVWMVGALSGMASMPFYMSINTTVVVYWIIQALVLTIINGIILGLVYKE
ncbi:MAG: hypothetical protein ABIH39_00060 [Candidatus Margulisiibacteriota bacterium]